MHLQSAFNLDTAVTFLRYCLFDFVSRTPAQGPCSVTFRLFNIGLQIHSLHQEIRAARGPRPQHLLRKRRAGSPDNAPPRWKKGVHFTACISQAHWVSHALAARWGGGSKSDFKLEDP